MIDFLVDPNKEREPLKERRIAFFEVSLELLADLLLLPNGVRITGIRESDGSFQKGTVEIRIECGDLPITPEGYALTRVNLQYRRIFHSEAQFVGWGI